MDEQSQNQHFEPTSTGGAINRDVGAIRPVELPPAHDVAPRCYRHPERETWVSCGRCGKPLCPDCMEHGPVGIRCRECAHPRGAGIGASVVNPDEVRPALIAAATLGAAWVVGILLVSVWVGWATSYSLGIPGVELPLKGIGGIWMPHLLLSAIAGGMVGWMIRRRCHNAWNALTIRTAVVIGLAIPFVVALALVALLLQRNGFFAVVAPQIPISGQDVLIHVVGRVFFLRTAAAMAASALFAWLLSHGRDDV